MTEFRMPSLGADMEAGTLVGWRAKPGDVLRRGDIIAEVETDKGLIEVEVFATGVLDRYLVEPGAKVPVGTPLAVLRELGGTQPALRPAAPEAKAEGPATAAEPAVVVPAAVPAAGIAAASVAAPPSARRRARELGIDLRTLATPAHVPTLHEVERAAAERSLATPSPSAARTRVSPAARRRARALGLDPTSLAGSGPGGAITLRDVEAASAPASAPLPAPPPRAAASAQSDRENRMRRTIAAAMARSKREIPHYYLATSIDLAAASAWLAQRNAERSVQERVLPAALLLKAVAVAAQRMPAFNTRFEADAARALPDVHLGVAIALRAGGLVAPAIHGADRLSLGELMAKLQDLVLRARAGRLRDSELRDGTITVSNLGDRGVETAFPIIYPPQTAIVAFGKIAERPWVVGGALAVRPIVQATLAADHRVTDGHLGARFLALIDQLLQEPGQL